MKYAFSRLLPLVAVTAFSLVALPASAALITRWLSLATACRTAATTPRSSAPTADRPLHNTYVPSQPYGSGSTATDQCGHRTPQRQWA